MDKIINLTIFTTTYNRAYLLPQLYMSLCKQTNTNFVWLIIDDGSTDNTRELVNSWIEHSIFEIKYIYQSNQGMHGGHNTAYSNISTEWNTCIDSDDYMPPQAVESILENLENLDKKYAGIVGLDIDKNGNVIGDIFPENLVESSLRDIYKKHKIRGDKKLVYNTSIVKNYPKYPLFKNENFVPLSYLYYLIDLDYKLKTVNEPWVVVEYQPDGSTKNIFKQYKKNPRGFAFARASYIRNSSNLKENFKNMIHLVSSALFTRDYRSLFFLNKPVMLILATPFGIILHYYIKIKTTNFK